MQDLRLFMKLASDAVTTEFAHDAEPLRLRMRLDSVADVAQVRAGAHGLDAAPHAFVRDFAQALRLDRRLPDIEHPAGVAVIAILDYRDVDVHDARASISSRRASVADTWFTEVQIDLG